MSTMEKLFAEIFIRKDRIIEQVQQQADSYTQQLVSKFLINGVSPPPWLLSPNFNFHSSNPNKLKKEEIISKLLLRPQHDSVSYSREDFSLYHRSVVAAGNGQLSNTTHMENDVLNIGVDVSNGPTTSNECHNNDMVCTGNLAAELDNSVKSPKNEMEARISSIYAAPDSSLARIQRSKSRQKARELRTNGKTASKSCLSNENRTHISFSENPVSISDFHQVTQDTFPLEMGKCNDISGATYMTAEGNGAKRNDRTSHSGTVATSSSSYEKSSFLIDHSKNSSSLEKKELDAGSHVQQLGSSLQQYDHVNSVMEGGKLPDVSLGSYEGKKSVNEKTQDDTHSQNKLFCGRITRSRSSSQQISRINRSLKLGTSVRCTPKEDGDELSKSVGNSIHGLNASNKLLNKIKTSQMVTDKIVETEVLDNLMLPLNASNKLADVVKTSQVLSDRIGETEALCCNEKLLNPVTSSNIADPQVTRFRSGSMKESSLGANHDENAEIVVINMPTEASVEHQAVNSAIKVDPITLCTKSEGVVLRRSPDCCRIFKPKQLNFDENDECDLNGICSPLSKKRKLDGLSGLEHYSSKESASSIDCKSSNTFSKQKLPKENVWSNSLKAAKTHTHKITDECINDETMNIVLDVTENQMLGDVEHNLTNSQQNDTDLTSEVNISPKEIKNIIDEQMHPRMSQLYEDHEFLSKMQIKEGDLGHRDEESSASVYTLISKNNSSLTKQANKDTKEDFGSSKSQEFEIESDPNLFNVKLSSAQADLSHKDEERAADVYEPLYKSTKSSFLSSVTKQGNNNSEQDLSFSKLKQFEIETKQKMSNVKLSSAKVNTLPCNQQMNVEEHPSCFSDSQNFSVHIHRDAIRCDLEASGNALHSVKKSASIPPSEETHVAQLDDIMRDMSEQRESLYIHRDAIRCDLEASGNGLHSVKEPASLPPSEETHVAQLDDMMCDLPEQRESLHMLRDAICCDPEASENGLHSIKKSASIPTSEEANVAQLDDMTCDLLERRESLPELQAAETVVTEVDDDSTDISDTLKQSEPICVSNMTKNSADDNTYSLAADVRNTNPVIGNDIVVIDNNSFEISLPEGVSSYDSVLSSRNDDKTDEILPVYEGFIIDEEVQNASIENVECGIDFDILEIPNTTIARASILEQICRSASMQTPLSEFSSKYKQHHIQDYYGFMSDGILERMDLGTAVDIRASDSDITETDSAFPFHQRFDFTAPFSWESKNHYSSPVEKFWERSASRSGSSDKKLSSNPELTCFPIEEDPCSDKENENVEQMIDELQENITSKVKNENSFRVSTEMKIDEVVVGPESTEVCSQHVNHESSFTKYQVRYSSSSVNVDVSVPRTRDKVKHTPRLPRGIKISRYNENRNSSMATRASSRGNLSEYSKNKSSMRSRITRLSQKKAKRNNIVSSISSFIPIVQQKQAAAICPAKRNIKVKALEAAEAAKRRAEEKENERKMKKEALKLEQARTGKENAREMELNKKKKQEELKKKEAVVAARKRQREEDEKKQVDKKRKLVAEAQKNQKLQLQYEKSRARKVDSEKDFIKATFAGNKKGPENPGQNKNAIKISLQRQDSDSSVVRQFTSVLENSVASSDCSEKEKATNIHKKSPVNAGQVMLTIQEKSYDISPYQSSDDEDDEEDLPKKSDKVIPSWASVTCVAMDVRLQQNLDTETIFPLNSFCNMDEVLLPRRLQAK